MKTLKERIESQCKHFTGSANKECAVGIKYEDVKEKDSRPYKFPCLKDNDFAGGKCAKVCWKTPGETDIKEMVKSKWCSRLSMAHN
jgi:hypothetical protein